MMSVRDIDPNDNFFQCVNHNMGSCTICLKEANGTWYNNLQGAHAVKPEPGHTVYVFGNNSATGEPEMRITRFLVVQFPNGDYNKQLRVQEAVYNLLGGFSLSYNTRGVNKVRALVLDVDVKMGRIPRSVPKREVYKTLMNEVATVVAAVAATVQGEEGDSFKTELKKKMIFLCDPNPEQGGKAASFHVHTMCMLQSKAATQVFWKMLIQHVEGGDYKLLQPSFLDPCVLGATALGLAFRSKQFRSKKTVQKTRNAGSSVKPDHAALMVNFRNNPPRGSLELKVNVPLPQASVASVPDTFSPDQGLVQKTVEFLEGKFPLHKIRAEGRTKIRLIPGKKNGATGKCLHGNTHASNTMMATLVDSKTVRLHCFSENKSCRADKDLLLPFDSDGGEDKMDEIKKRASVIRKQGKLDNGDYDELLALYQTGLLAAVEIAQTERVIVAYLEPKQKSNEKLPRLLEASAFLKEHFQTARKKLFDTLFKDMIFVADDCLMRLMSVVDPGDKIQRWVWESVPIDKVRKSGDAFFGKQIMSPLCEAKRFKNQQTANITFAVEITTHMPFDALHKKGVRASAVENPWGNSLVNTYFGPYHSVKTLKERYRRGDFDQGKIMEILTLVMEFLFTHMCSDNMPVICRLMIWAHNIMHGIAQQATLPVFIGPPGKGKTLMAEELFKKALGSRHSLTVANRAAMGDKFGFSALMGFMLVVLEEFKLDDTQNAEMRSCLTDYSLDNQSYALRGMNRALRSTERGHIGFAMMLLSNSRDAVSASNNGNPSRRALFPDISSESRSADFFEALAKHGYLVIDLLLQALPPAVLTCKLPTMSRMMRSKLQEECQPAQREILGVLRGILQWEEAKGSSREQAMVFASFGAMNFAQLQETKMRFWYGQLKSLHGKRPVSFPVFLETAKTMLYLSEPTPSNFFLDSSYTPKMQHTKALASLENRNPTFSELQQGRLSDIQIKGPPGCETSAVLKHKVLEEVKKQIAAWSVDEDFEAAVPVHPFGYGLESRPNKKKRVLGPVSESEED
jgi:hypothetical protein